MMGFLIVRTALKETIRPPFVLNLTIAGFLIVLIALNLTVFLLILLCYHYLGSIENGHFKSRLPFQGNCDSLQLTA
jgi:hypothetical protein